MKNTISHILKKGTILLSISILFLLSNCQQEELISDNAVQPKSEFKTRVLDKSELQLNISLTNKLDVVQKAFSNKKNKSVYSELYDFTIETDYAELIENEDGTFQSYTFPISRTTSNDLIENFILTLQEDGSYDATYISYNLTEQEKDDINNNISVNLANKTNIVEITDDFLIFEVVQNKVSGYQLVEVTTWTYNSSCSNGFSEPNCTDQAGHNVGWVATISYILVYISGNSSTSGVPDNADGGGSNYGSGFGGSGGFNYSTVTRPRDPNISKYNSFKRRYGRTVGHGTNLLTENPLVSQQVFDFLKPDFSDEDEDFALLGLEIIANQEVVNFDEFIRIIDQMDKECQAEIVADAVFIDSTITNTIFNTLVVPTDNHILFFDLPSGSGTNQVPENTAAETELIPMTIDGVSGQSMVIYFNDDYLDTATDLSIFSITIHEMLHAYLYNLYHNDLLLSTYPQYTALNTAIYNFIEDGSSINDEILKVEAHNVYVDFIDALAESIVQYAQDKGIEDVDIIYARKLVWGGLFDPNNNNNVFTNNLTVPEQLEAKNIAINEHTNHPNAKGSNNCNDD